MKNPPRARTPPPKPRSPGSLRAIVLAVGVHAAFFALIVFGVNWQSTPTPPVEAEIWDKLPPVKTVQAKPEPEPPKPEPEPPKPEPKPQPPPPPPKPPEVKPEPPKPDPAIALKAEREKREKEKRERLEKEKLDKKKEDEAKKKREDERRKKDEEIAKAALDKARAEAAAQKKSEFDSWVKRIQDSIRNRANVPDTVTGKPEVHVLIRILPGGEVLDITVTKRSGNPTYDMAIERGIRSASPLPVPPVTSELFPQFRELNLIIKHER